MPGQALWGMWDLKIKIFSPGRGPTPWYSLVCTARDSVGVRRLCLQEKVTAGCTQPACRMWEVTAGCSQPVPC